MSEPERPPIADFMEMAKVEMVSFAGSVVTDLCAWIEHIEARNAALKQQLADLNCRDCNQRGAFECVNCVHFGDVKALDDTTAGAQEERSIQASLTETLAVNAALRATVERYREALKWYADEKNYEPYQKLPNALHSREVVGDGGQRAREALTDVREIKVSPEQMQIAIERATETVKKAAPWRDEIARLKEEER